MADLALLKGQFMASVKGFARIPEPIFQLWMDYICTSSIFDIDFPLRAF